MGIGKEDLTVTEALSAILRSIEPLAKEKVRLSESLGRVIATPIVAHEAMPPFANSAMDGYVVRAEDLAQIPIQLNVVGDIAAGHAPSFRLEKGCAARIMTGAPIPEGGDAVVPVEDTDEAWRGAKRPLPELIQIWRQVEKGAYVRLAGEDMKAGQLIMNSGHLIRSQEVGVLAMLGVSQLAVFRKPKVGILATGDELIDIDQPLTPGKIRNSNLYTQIAQIEAAGGVPIPLGVAKDTEADVRAKLQTGLAHGVDLFVSSAGVSVGAYDVVKSVLETGGDVGFWRVRMRPGKPLAYGLYGGVPYLGLPGNPVSAMISFELFARAVIYKMQGRTDWARLQIPVLALETLRSDGRESYLRAIIERDGEQLVGKLAGGQESNMMRALVEANGLLILPEGVKVVEAGELVTAILF